MEIKKYKKTKLKKANFPKELSLLNFFAFIIGFQCALNTYINSSFLKENSGTKNVGIFFLLAYGGSLLILLNMHHLVKRYGKKNTFLFFLAIEFVALLGAGAFSRNVGGAFFTVILLLASPLIWVALDILVEGCSQNKITGAIRGKYLSIMNFGWFLAPFAAATLISRFGYSAVYYICAVSVLLVIVVSLKNFNWQTNRLQKQDFLLEQILKKAAARDNITRIFYISFVLEVFYAAMVIYMPLMLLGEGFSWREIGIIFSVMLIPFFLIQYPIGVIADKKTGEKEMLAVALVIMSTATFLLYFFGDKSMFFWMAGLFATRVGAAIIEILRDSFFYKQVNFKDVDLIDFFRTTRSLAYILTAGLFGILSFFLPIRGLMVFLAGFVLTGFLPLWKMKDSR
jgi:MFS family permease